MSTEASPRPWHASDDAVFVGVNCLALCDTDVFTAPINAANAALIVKAVNAHDDLVAALQEVMEWVRNWSPQFLDDDEWPDTAVRVAAALSKAGEQP